MNRDDMDFKGLARDLNRQRENNNNNNHSPQFTRRHYVFLASVMRDINYYMKNGPTEPNDRPTVAHVIIDMFAEALTQNENFDKQMFLDNVFCPNLIKTEN